MVINGTQAIWQLGSPAQVAERELGSCHQQFGVARAGHGGKHAR
jgi:hypothetical protein